MSSTGGVGPDGPKRYSINKARISADRSKGKFIDIETAIADLVLYEHLDNAYMTGSMTIVDSVDLYRLMAFQGTEKLELEISYDNEDSNLLPFIKTFVITSVSRSVRSFENLDVLKFTLTEEHMFLNKAEVISKAVKGKPNEIISEILADTDLDVEVELVSDVEAQGPFKYLIPYLNPLHAVDNILKTATTVEGFPYFLYSTITKDKKLEYKSLDDILSDMPLVSKSDPFQYSIVKTQLSEQNIKGTFSANPELRGLVTPGDLQLQHAAKYIEKYEIVNLENTISMLEMGVIGADRQVINVNEWRGHQSHDSILETLESIKDKLPNDQKKLSYDDKAYEGLHNKAGQQFTHLFSSHTYSDNSANLYDAGAYPGDEIIPREGAEDLKAYMEKSPVNITVPGYMFWPRTKDRDTRSLGKNFFLRFMSSDIEGVEKDRPYDRHRSGQYFCYAAAHVFTQDGYSVNMTAVKYSHLEKDL